MFCFFLPPARFPCSFACVFLQGFPVLLSSALPIVPFPFVVPQLASPNSSHFSLSFSSPSLLAFIQHFGDCLFSHPCVMVNKCEELAPKHTRNRSCIGVRFPSVYISVYIYFFFFPSIVGLPSFHHRSAVAPLSLHHCRCIAGQLSICRRSIIVSSLFCGFCVAVPSCC